jgi:succinoglycan biosynthesis transport protein ExoP
MSELQHLDTVVPEPPRSGSAAESRGAPPSGPPVVNDGVDDVHLLDYLKVLYIRRWTVGTVFLVIFLGVLVYTFTVTPRYEARTRLLIESDDPNVVSFKEVIEEGASKADYYQTQYTILESRALARKTIDTLGLWRSPLLQDSRWEIDGIFGRAASSVWTALGHERGPVRSEGITETLAQSRVIDRFLEQLTIAPIRNSRLVDVKFRSSDPDVATRVANVLARAYIDQNLDYKFGASKEATSWLEDRLAEQRAQVEKAEAALQQYREQHDAIPLEDRENIVVQKLGDLNAAVTKAKTERLQKEAVYRQITAIGNNQAALDTFPAILANQFIQQQKSELANLQREQAQLADKLGDRHPEMIKIQSAIQTAQAKLQGEIANVGQAIRTEYEAALTQERGLIAALDQQKLEAQSMNRKAIEYSVLDRDVKSSRQMYDGLLQRAKETGIAGELKASNIRVVDQAERPRKPVTPQPFVNLSLALLGGIVFACGLAFFFEYMDSRIKSPDELTTHLGLAPLGLIPTLGKNWHGSEPLINNGVPQNFAEAFRALRTNVLFSFAEEGPRTLVVTSTGPGEGKTTVASNLATGFAMAGERTLLVDADMRRPGVHDVFKCQREPGLSNVLVGNAKPSESMKKSDVPGLWVMASGHIPPNPAELLASRQFRDLLRSLGEHFDYIVIDTPPVMVVTDAVVAAHVASGVVFVVEAEIVSRHAAKTAVQHLANGRARFLGGVLNKVNVEAHGYYYSDYVDSGYSYYEGRDVSRARKPRALVIRSPLRRRRGSTERGAASGIGRSSGVK